MKTIKALALNLGSTSTKAAYFENGECVLRQTLNHPAEELSRFVRFWDQEDYRREAVERFMAEHDLRPENMDAFVTWGGHTSITEAGVYRITPLFLEQSASEKYGNHPGDLGPRLVYTFAAAAGCEGFTVDPPTIDEFGPLARYTGLPEVKRRSRMQTLNHKATARRYAKDSNRTYEELRLIVVHFGGGISVAAHDRGRIVDANNGLDGDGPFGPNRSGSLPAGDVIDLCYSGEYTCVEMKKKVSGRGGLVAHLGENDVRVVEERAGTGDKKAADVLDAMLYQTAKEISAMAAVLCGDVDGIVLTGGASHSWYVTESIRKRVAFIAPIAVYPGEMEMESLGQMSYEALMGREKIKEIEEGTCSELSRK
jgi:butyrate kinase